jgi:cellulose synthase/poly-beta-1,6-N-acetylglucosamine synthase-like glycosyltransferase
MDSKITQRVNKRLKCSIGILIHNEAGNIGKLLEALLNQKLKQVKIVEIIVVSSASTDGSDDIVKEYAEKEPLIKLITEPERRGKSAAINTFLAEAKEEIVLISSGDVIPEYDTIEKLIFPFRDKKVGMTGGRPVPINSPDSFVGYWVNLQWNLHHRIALRSPKLGEMVAFRKIMDSIPADSAVDEASIEALVTGQNLKLLYIPAAIIHNKGPESVREFIVQRRRIAAGHLWLKQKNSYRVSTNQPGLLLTVLWEEVRNKPVKIPYLLVICLLEVYSRYLGWFDLKIRKKNPFKWTMIGSTKQVNQRLKK